jgi:hypothetical protein
VQDASKSTRLMPVRRRLRLVVLLLIAVTGIWLLTATWGVSDVVAMADRGAQRLNQELGPLNRIEFDPDVRPSLGEKKMPWYFIGKASSPCPLIVAVDCAHQVADLAGQRSRVYVFWLFGLTFPIYQSVDWMS